MALPTEIAESPSPVASPTARRRRDTLRHRLAVADALAAASSGLVAGALDGLSGPHSLLLGLVLTAVWLVLAFSFGLYGQDDLRSWATGVSEAAKLALLSVVVSWPAFGVVSLLGANAPAVVGLVVAALVGATSALARAAVRSQLHAAPDLRLRTLIVGSGVVARDLTARLRSHPALGLVPVGFIDDDVHEGSQLPLPRMGDLAALPDLLASGKVDRVIIAFTRAGHDELLACIRACRDAGIGVDVVPRLFEFLDGARTVDHIGGMPLLSISVPSLSPASRAAKRAMDLFVATLLLTIFLPVLIAVALAIRLETRGPVLFRQARVGRYGRSFTILKFRSMYVDAEARKLTLVDTNDLSDGVMFKIHADPRITRVGGFLRRLSLDELPQLWNVVRGEMSLVGPRPLIHVEAAALAADWEHRRVDLRPGLTGPWQISGRSDVPFHEMVRFDYQYVAGWSLARDLEILLATVPAVVAGRGAY